MYSIDTLLISFVNVSQNWWFFFIAAPVITAAIAFIDSIERNSSFRISLLQAIIGNVLAVIPILGVCLFVVSVVIFLISAVAMLVSIASQSKLASRLSAITVWSRR